MKLENYYRIKTYVIGIFLNIYFEKGHSDF